jgi:hypothetical protein
VGFALVLNRVRFVLNASDFKQTHEVMVGSCAADTLGVEAKRSLRFCCDTRGSWLDVHGSKKGNPFSVPLILNLHRDLDAANVNNMTHCRL